MATKPGILEWTNEHSVSNYPLAKSIGLMDFIVDASFVQFDGFVPTLKTITVKRTQLTLLLSMDVGDVQVVVNKPSSFSFPGTSVFIERGERYLGALVFGQGLVDIFVQHLDAVLKVNAAFVPSVVRGVSSKGGVYTLADRYGDVPFTTGGTPQTRALFFDVAGDDVTWNAGWVGNFTDRVPLRTLNKVLPIANSVVIEDSDLIKVTPEGNGLSVSVILPISKDVVSPVKKYE